MVYQRKAAEQGGAQPPVQRQHQLADGRLRLRRHMGFASLKVVAVGMVHGVAALPGEVRHQQQAVEAEPHQRLNTTVGVERLMAALMGDDPAAHRHGAGDQPVDQPEGGRTRRKGDLGAEAVGQ